MAANRSPTRSARALRGAPALLAAGAVLLVLGACSGLRGVAPGVILSGTDLGILRKADGAEAVYASDLTQVEATLSVESADFPLAEGVPGIGGTEDTLGVNFVYQAPTRFRAKQTTPDDVAKVTGRYTYAVVNFYDRFSEPFLDWWAQRMSFGLGFGRLEIEGEADFVPGPPRTRIDPVRVDTTVFYLSFETARFAGVENLLFRGAAGIQDGDDDRFAYLVSGVSFTFGYLFGAEGEDSAAASAPAAPAP